MNAFISYSITRNEQYILNLLAKRLSDIGWTLVTGYGSGLVIDYQTKSSIENSVLFIGLITRTPQYQDTHVLTELNYALQTNTPSILLIERGSYATAFIHQYPNTIWFDRNDMDSAIREVKTRIERTQLIPNSNPDNAAWLLGGLAVLALLAYLDNKK